jgi:hypothetical protein
MSSHARWKRPCLQTTPDATKHPTVHSMRGASERVSCSVSHVGSEGETGEGSRESARTGDSPQGHSAEVL